MVHTPLLGYIHVILHMRVTIKTCCVADMDLVLQTHVILQTYGIIDMYVVVHVCILCYTHRCYVTDVSQYRCVTLYPCSGIDVCCDTCMAELLHTCVLCYMCCLTNVCCVKYVLCYIHVCYLDTCVVMSYVTDMSIVLYVLQTMCVTDCVLCYRPCAAVTTYTAVRLARYVMWPRRRAPRVPSACPGKRRHLP